MKKTEMLHRIDQEWLRLNEAIRMLSDEDQKKDQIVGLWTIKDLMAHLSNWESVCLERLGRIRRGEEIEIVPDDEVDKWNMSVYEKYRNQKLEIVQGEFEHIHSRLVNGIDDLPDELWNRNAEGVIDWIADNTYAHYAEHLEKLTAALARRDKSTQTKAHQ